MLVQRTSPVQGHPTLPLFAMSRPGKRGRPATSIEKTNLWAPTELKDHLDALVRDRGFTKDEAWAHVLEKLSPPPTSGDEDDDDAPPQRARGAQGKRDRAAEDEEDEEEDDPPEVSEQELSDHVESIPSAVEALEEARQQGADALEPLVELFLGDCIAGILLATRKGRDLRVAQIAL